MGRLVGEVGGGRIRGVVPLAQIDAADGQAVTAATHMTGLALGYKGRIEQVYLRINAAGAGASASVTWQLTDGSDNVIAEITVVVASATDGAVISVSTLATSGDGIRVAFRDLVDATTLKVKRKATGTAYSTGPIGELFAVLAQPMQAIG